MMSFHTLQNLFILPNTIANEIYSFKHRNINKSPLFYVIVSYPLSPSKRTYFTHFPVSSRP